MTAHHEAPNGFTSPNHILAQCTELMPTDQAYKEHGIIQRFGSPKHRANCHKEQAEHYHEEWERIKGGKE